MSTKSRPTQHPEKPWYKGGLKFACTQCGRCCRGEPGYVWVTPAEVAEMAEFLGVSDDRFMKRYCRQVFSRTSLIEFANGDCVFYSPEGCRVYPVRPSQCRSFPFWSHIMHSKEEWENLKKTCPGVGTGRTYTQREIDDILSKNSST